jgi:hypothetical protein
MAGSYGMPRSRREEIQVPMVNLIAGSGFDAKIIPGQLTLLWHALGIPLRLYRSGGLGAKDHG